MPNREAIDQQSFEGIARKRLGTSGTVYRVFCTVREINQIPEVVYQRWSTGLCVILREKTHENLQKWLKNSAALLDRNAGLVDSFTLRILYQIRLLLLDQN